MRRRAFLTGLAVAGWSRAYAEDIGRHVKALSGDRFEVNGQEFLLADIMAPPLYTLTNAPPAYFESSRRALQAMLSGALDVEDALPETRWSVRRVKAKRFNDAQMLQEKLVALGAVRVAPQSEDHDLIRGLLALEQEARKQRRGLWALPDYRIFDADDASGAVGAYHLVEGTVIAAALHGARFYLNFGEDFHDDFTVSTTSRLYRRWKKAGLDLAALSGGRIRARGLVEAINGPSIDLKHVLQIERLD